MSRTRPIVPSPGQPVSVADVMPPRAWDHMTVAERIATVTEREWRRTVATAERRQQLERAIDARLRRLGG